MGRAIENASDCRCLSSARYNNSSIYRFSTYLTFILRSQNASSSWGGSRYKPYVFTEQGIAMLSGVLNSETAVNVNISIMRAFVCMRQFALSHTELTRKLECLEVLVDQKFTDVYKALEYLIDKNVKDINQSKRKRIGFKPDN